MTDCSHCLGALLSSKWLTLERSLKTTVDKWGYYLVQHLKTNEPSGFFRRGVEVFCRRVNAWTDLTFFLVSFGFLGMEKFAILMKTFLFGICWSTQWWSAIIKLSASLLWKFVIAAVALLVDICAGYGVQKHLRSRSTRLHQWSDYSPNSSYHTVSGNSAASHCCKNSRIAWLLLFYG